MHICLATHEFPPLTSGGISTYYAALAKLLAAAGHGVTVLTPDRDSTSEHWTHPGVEVVRLRRTVASHSQQLAAIFPPELNGAIEVIAIGLAMRDWLRSEGARRGVEVVDAPEYLGTAAFLIEDDLPAVAVTCHGSFAQVHRHQEAWQPSEADLLIVSLEQMSVAGADQVVCYSVLNRDEWRDLLGRTPALVAAPLEMGEVRPRRPTTQGDVLTGVVAGRLQNWKGALETLQALSQCVATGTAVKLRWIGGDTATAPDGGSMRSYLAHEFDGLWGTVFTWQDVAPPSEVRRMQAEADFALAPSRWDTFNFTAVEAMWLGTPLIVSSGAGASYLCTEGEDALIVPPGDPEALAAAMQRLCGDAALRARLGEAGRRTIAKALAPERVVREHLAAYETAIARHTFRGERGYTPTLLHPFVRQWARTAELTSDEAVLARTGGRRLSKAALSKLARRFKK